MKKGLAKLISMTSIPLALIAGGRANSSYACEPETNEVRTTQYNEVMKQVEATQTDFVQTMAKDSKIFVLGLANYGGKTRQKQIENCIKSCVEGERIIVEAARDGKTAYSDITNVVNRIGRHSTNTDHSVKYFSSSVVKAYTDDVGVKLEFYENLFNTGRTNFPAMINGAYLDAEDYKSRFLDKAAITSINRNIAMKSSLGIIDRCAADGVFNYMSKVERKMLDNFGTNIVDKVDKGKLIFAKSK